jgi:hypothetical protein
MPITRLTYGPGGFTPGAPSSNVVSTGTVPDDTSPQGTMTASLAGQLDLIRADITAVDTDRLALVARLNAAAPTTLAQAVPQLRELQDFVRRLDVAYERTALATLRLARLVVGALDAVD